MGSYKRITREERFKIWALHYEKGLNFRQIAIKLGRAPKTIYAEVKNNRLRSDISLDKFPYNPEYADRIAMDNRVYRKYGKIQTKRATMTRIKKAVDENKWSISMIANGVKDAPTATTLYRYMKRGFYAFENYKKRKYKKRYSKSIRARQQKSKRDLTAFVAEHTISKRPNWIDKRKKYGQWEMDCVDSPLGVNASLLVLVERRTRYVTMYPVKSKRYDHLGLALKKFLSRYHRHVESITTDRGTEFINFKVADLIESYGINVYYADPYKPHQKGTIERINRDIRKFFPSGTSFSQVKPWEVRHVKNIINHYPREVLSWQTPYAEFNKFVARNRRSDERREAEAKKAKENNRI